MASDKPLGISWIRSSFSMHDHAECVEAAVVPAGSAGTADRQH
ncbi:hypothetical protein [Actinoallomurus sp. NPDC050550]